jgi:hypothetical protein
MHSFGPSTHESATFISRSQELKAQKQAEKEAKEAQKAAEKAAEKAAKEARRESTLSTASSASKTRSKETGGGHVWIRNENLTMRVGALPRGWEKKIDPVRGGLERVEGWGWGCKLVPVDGLVDRLVSLVQY